MAVRIGPQVIDPNAELAAFARDSEAGAVVSFTGYCRHRRGENAVQWLDLEHYPGFTEAEIERLTASVRTRHGLLDLLVLHRVGRILPGEAIVLVAAQSAHRASAFAAVEQMMDYLKTDAVIWKRETRDDGAHWIEPTDDDRARRASIEER